MLKIRWMTWLFGIFLILPICVLFPFTIFAETTIHDAVFVILRCIREKKHESLWKTCYCSIREFYPEVPIVIIDDNSLIKTSDENLKNTTIIQSEYPGAGELLPYYYFLKYEWADKIIFLHDSMFLLRPFSLSELNHPVRFHWFFEKFRTALFVPERINELLEELNFADSLISYMNTGRWRGCFGVASIINLEALKTIENKYFFTSNLIDKIKTRVDRMSLERVFAIIVHYEGLVNIDNCHNFGDILKYPNAFRLSNAGNKPLPHISTYKSKYSSAIGKVWMDR